MQHNIFMLYVSNIIMCVDISMHLVGDMLNLLKYFKGSLYVYYIVNST